MQERGVIRGADEISWAPGSLCQDGCRYFTPETVAAIDSPADGRGGGSTPAHDEFINPTRGTPCYTTCWDLTTSRRPVGHATPA